MRSNLKKYQSRNFLQRFLIRRFFEKIRKIVNELPAGAVCDLGCGEGFVLKDLSAHGSRHERDIIGVDLDQEALKFASTHCPGASFVCATAHHLPFRARSFQNLLLLEVLEHLEFPGKALVEAARVSRMMLVSVPHEPFFQIANFFRGKNLSRWGNDIEHVQHWNKRSFHELLKPYGTIVRLETSFPWLIALVKIF